MNKRIYLDYNATTPCDPEVVNGMLPFFTQKFGNAASKTHSFGWEAEETVDISRQRIANLIGADKNEIIFTSGATESDNLAIKGVWDLNSAIGNRIITCVTEHKAVLDTCHYLKTKGADVVFLPVNKDGLINLVDLENAINSNTILISIMYANNETGVIQPLKEIGQIAKKNNVFFMSDCVQAAGKIPTNVKELGIDLLTISGHKIYGPKGVGALFVRNKEPKVKINSQIHGGGHERAMRSGTLNVTGIVGLGLACELCKNNLETESKRLLELRNYFENEMLSLGGVTINGIKANRLNHVSNLSFDGVVSSKLMLKIKEIAVSSGSACTSAVIEPSFVLKAMGIEDEMANATLRISLGRFTTKEEIDFAIKRIKEEVLEMRK